MMLVLFMLLVAALVIGLIAGTAAALWRWRRAWRWIAGLPLLGVLLIAARIVVDVNADPTSHNLWPFEVLAAVIVAGVALGLMAFVRLVLHRSNATY